MQTTQLNLQEPVFTVSQLNNQTRCLLENNFASIWVEGEISNFAAPASGHWYFCLKDEKAQVRCALFRMQARKLGFTPKDGMHVLIKAKVSLYETRGEFQLLAEYLEERGEGKLQRAFEAMKKKLLAAGLFDEKHKKALPLFPNTIGVVTSATGAAIRDILHVLARRFPAAQVIIYPSLVQGAQASANLEKSIKVANQRAECDVLILARGGGSLEDLWPFNEENLAYAIFESSIPIISGVGHEVDFTIADFVADKRAPTPSAAAEIITPDKDDLLQTLQVRSQHLARSLDGKLKRAQEQITWIVRHLNKLHPKEILYQRMQYIDGCIEKLQKMLLNQLMRLKLQRKHAEASLQQHSPQKNIQLEQSKIKQQAQTLLRILTQHINKLKHQLIESSATLDTLSPLATLKRGFAIASDDKQRILTDANEVALDAKIKVKLLHGSLACRVVEKNS